MMSSIKSQYLEMDFDLSRADQKLDHIGSSISYEGKNWEMKNPALHMRLARGDPGAPEVDLARQRKRMWEGVGG